MGADGYIGASYAQQAQATEHLADCDPSKVFWAREIPDTRHCFCVPIRRVGFETNVGEKPQAFRETHGQCCQCGARETWRSKHRKGLKRKTQTGGRDGA